MKEQIEKDIKKKIRFLEIIFWIFIFGSVFGFFAEMLYAAIFTRTFVIRKGLIYGPFIQIYGMGAVAYYILICKVKEPKEAFLYGMIMGGILEYLGSFFQELLFGTISWDYSQMYFNLNGRVCLLYCFYWGIIAVAYLKLAYEPLQKLEPMLEKKWVKILTVFLVIFMVFDVTISSLAALREDERRKGIAPKNKIEKFIDKAYPDEYVDKIYNNKKNID